MRKKTKIVCTMGPNTDNREIMEGLVREGMDIARFNFSHGDHEEQRERMDLLKSVREEYNLPIAILLDTKGPEIRTGLLKEKTVTLTAGQKFILTTEEIEGDENRVSITYAGLPEDVEPGNKILIDDGLIGLVVEEVEGTEIICSVENGGTFSSKKGVNVPNVKVNLPPITEKDKEDIIFGIEQEVDFIAASFVRTAEAVHQIRAILREYGADRNINIIAKIENQEGVDNIDSILAAADGIMVARGDLGVEIPAERVPFIQKELIHKCNESYKPVITATQMLDSMIRNPRPTRAEVTDVANAIYDGTDAIMLSGETAMGKYPVEALKTMANIATETERHLDYEALIQLKREYRSRGISSAVSYAAVATARNLDASCVITSTMSGFTTRMVSKFKPKADIISFSPSESTCRRMQIYWGVTSFPIGVADTMDELIDQCIVEARERKLIKKGDVIVVTAGTPSLGGKAVNTNTIKVERM